MRGWTKWLGAALGAASLALTGAWTPADAASQTVTAVSAGFVAPVVAIASGDSITLHNPDALLPHTLPSTASDPNGNPLFTTGTVPAGGGPAGRGAAALPCGRHPF